MTKTKHVVGWALAIGAAAVCGCSGLPTTAVNSVDAPAADTGRHVRFTTTEFTRPNIDVSPDGREFFFDVLGEIYRAPVTGGEAERLDLGAGWKSYPRLSRDGERIAFVSDKDDAAGVWGKRLDASGSVYFHAGATSSQTKGLAWVGNGQLASIHRERRDATQFTLAVSEVDGSGKRIAVDPVVLTRTRGLHLIGAPGDDESVYLFGERGSIVKANIRTGTTVPVLDHLPGPDFLFQQEGIVGQFRLSRDGRLIGYALAEGSDTRLAIYDQTSRRHTVTACSLERSTANGVQTVPYPTYAFLPGGKSVLLSRGGKFHHCSLADGTAHEIAISADIDIALAPMAVRRADDPDRTQIRYPALDAKRDEIAFTAYGRLWKIGVDGQDVARLTQARNEELMPAYSPDGTRLAYVTQKDDVVALRVRDIASGRETIVIQSKEVAYANPAWSPDSRRIAYLEVDQRASLHSGPKYMIRFVDLEAGKHRVIGSTGPRTTTGHLYASPTWSADGGGVYYIREGYSEETWQSVLELVHQTPGSAPTLLMTFGAAIDVVVSPDGRYAAVQDGLGISIMPLVASMTASPGEARHVSLAELQTMRRIPANGADYVLWTKDNRLLWSIQDEVFLSKDLSTAERLFKVTMPAAQTEPDDIEVYVGGRVISMTNQGVIEDGAIVTSGRKIGYVGPASDVPSRFDSAMRIDVSGKTIIPGLIDVHMHRSFTVDDFSSLTDYALFASAAYGVTTVYDPSLSMVKSAYLTDISREDRYRGATFYGSGGILFGGKKDLNYMPVDSVDDARGYIDRLAKAGTPLLKSYERTSRRERKFIAQAAREAGIGIASHEVYELGVQLGTVQDGYTSLEHTLTLNSVPVYSDVTGYLKGSEVSLTPTLALSGKSPKVLVKRTMRDTRSSCLIESEWTSSDTDRMRRVPAGPELQDFARASIGEYARMLNDGLLVSIGGHNDSPAGVFSHWEMWALALGGATPMNVLRAATVNGAIKLNMQDRIGSIAEGMDADFVVLNSNPLDDIYNTTDIARVVRRGHTLEWPEGAAFPQSWPVDADWDACQAWNLGIPRTDEQMQSVLN